MSWRARPLLFAVCLTAPFVWAARVREQQPAPSPTAGSVREDMPSLRRKAWALLHQLRLSGIPDSTTFVHEFSAYTRGPALNDVRKAWTGMRALELPENVPATPASAESTTAPPVLYESTFFNAEAVESIRRMPFPLYDSGTSKRLRDEFQRREIDDFKKGSIVIKTFWRALPANGDHVKVGIWQWPRKEGVDDATVDFRENAWAEKECVERDPLPGSKCLRAQDAFHTAVVNNPNAFCSSDNPDRCKDLIQGQMLIMIAAHIIEKDRPDWFWATFWWKGDGKNGTTHRTSGKLWPCDNADRSDDFTGFWGNYSMDVTVSSMGLTSSPLKPEFPNTPEGRKEFEECGYPQTIGRFSEERRAMFNPFIEGHLQRGRKSNCIVCHARASSNSAAKVFVVQDVDYIGGFQLGEFEGHVRTDYIWTVRKYFGMTP